MGKLLIPKIAELTSDTLLKIEEGESILVKVKEMARLAKELGEDVSAIEPYLAVTEKMLGGLKEGLKKPAK